MPCIAPAKIGSNEKLWNRNKEFPEKNNGSNVIVLKSYIEDSKKRDAKDFVSYFKARYITLRNILQGRQEKVNFQI